MAAVGTWTFDPTVPERLGVAEQKMLRATGKEMAAAIGSASRSRQIAAKTRVLSVGAAAVTIGVGVGVPFAKLRDRGGWIAPKRKRVLRFADGGFRPSARHEGIHYIDAASRAGGTVAGVAFKFSFGKV